MKRQINLEELQQKLSVLAAGAFHAVESPIEKLCRHRLRTGLRHGHRKYTGLIDAVMGSSAMECSVDDILHGKAECPNNCYEVGRHMAQANKFLRKGMEIGDVDAAFTGVRIYEWLGQGHRNSVRNKMNKAYQKAREIARHYTVPLSVEGDYALAVLPNQLRREVEGYLNGGNKNGL